jgi:signal transduction histidine kinase
LVVERALDLTRYRLEQANIDVRCEFADPLPTTTFDESAITLLVLNLVENALKYGLERGDTLRVGVAMSADGRALVLTVQDHGPGIAKEQAKRIFERFYRGSVAKERGQRGSGIGLSLVKHIAEAHGGEVRVHSELGKGATFEVTIPVREEGGK